MILSLLCEKNIHQLLTCSLQWPLHLWNTTNGFPIQLQGADPRAVNGEGKTPFELAVESNFVDSDVLALLSDSNG
ncbi:hypothetical protein CK203_044851 [Vitis vinifera]|uniref:Uncharacterized protein n=1 Tax=Vitis vinifera TaxID=29760 RepID=A0A438H0R8_VITVI|nr:hypothetical protein CK203_044851 [Vitis vinifera]